MTNINVTFSFPQRVFIDVFGFHSQHGNITWWSSNPLLDTQKRLWHHSRSSVAVPDRANRIPHLCTIQTGAASKTHTLQTHTEPRLAQTPLPHIQACDTFSKWHVGYENRSRVTAALDTAGGETYHYKTGKITTDFHFQTGAAEPGVYTCLQQFSTFTNKTFTSQLHWASLLTAFYLECILLHDLLFLRWDSVEQQ